MQSLKNIMKWICTFAAFASLNAGFLLLAADFKFPGQTLNVPDGFEVELVAGGPLIERPVSMDFDEEGRLYVTLSSGSNDNVQKQLADKPHSVVRLEDTDGDGKFDRKTLFADKLMLPQGAMWFDGSLYVSAPPSIWKLTDTDDDGVSDKREEWFSGKTLTGCANDLHGPYLGPDGWIYWCKGAFAEQTYQVNGKPFITRASHIFRARPDGSHFEPVMTGGMDNPVGIEFTPTGERLVVGTFFQLPEAGKRDGILHAVYGGVFGKVNAVLDGHKRTGDLMAIMTHLGSAAPCSIIQYRSKGWGEEFGQNLFVCNFNLHSVTRHLLESSGATFRTQDKTFLTSDSPDFHPTCVLEDADGSLLVIDTGGWYKLCCPTSQLWKPDLTGAIYRVRRTNAKKTADPRGMKVDWKNATPEGLVQFLDDPRPRVVTRATHQLASRKTESIAALHQTLLNSKSEDARRNAVWALTQIDDPKAREAIYAAFPSGAHSLLRPDDSVAQTAIYSIGLWRDRDAIYAAAAFPATVGMADALGSSNLAMRRAAVEAFGRIGDRSYGMRRLWDATTPGGPVDRILEHSSTYALLELNDPDATAERLAKPATQRIALIALDQMGNGHLKPEQVIPLLSSTNGPVRDAALWVIGHHPDWGVALASYFKEKLTNQQNSNAGEGVVRELVTFAGNPTIQELLATALADTTVGREGKVIVLKAMTQAGIAQAPASWSKQFTSLLQTNETALIHEAVRAARAVPAAPEQAVELGTALVRVAEDSAHPVDVRLMALSAVAGSQSLSAPLFDFIRKQIHPEQPVTTRTLAVGVLSKAQLTDEQLALLVEDVKAVGPMELAKVLSAFEKSQVMLSVLN